MIFLDKINSPAAREVFRQHHITAKGLEGVRQGHERKGDKFMFDLLKSISPKSSVLHGNFNDYLNLDTVDTSELDSNIDSDLGLSTKKPKKTFTDWMNIFTTLGETYASVKGNITGSTPAEGDIDTPAPNKSKFNTTIIYVVVAIIILTIGFFIYKQSKS